MGVRDLWRIAALMVLFSLISVLSMPVPARAAGVPIEGNLLVEYSDESTGFSRVLHGRLLFYRGTDAGPQPTRYLA